MADTKISAALDTTPPLATDMLPLARAGDNTARKISVGNLRGGVFNVKDYGAVGDGIADDTVAIQIAINAAAAGGVVFIPGGKYLLSASLVPKNGVTIRGVYPGATSTDPNNWDLGFVVDTGSIITFPGGVAFAQDMSGGIGTLSALQGMVLESLGFDNVLSILVSGAKDKFGLAGCVVRDILASNVTGIAFDISNMLQNHFSNIRACCSQLIRISADVDHAIDPAGPGNCLFEDMYAFISAAGHPLPSVHLRSIVYNASGGPINFCHFVRLQINRFALADHTGNHILLEGGATLVNGCIFDGLDLEGYSQYVVKGTTIAKCQFNFIEVTDTASDASLYLRNSDTVIIHSAAYGFYTDLDTTDNLIILIGNLQGIVGDSVPPSTMPMSNSDNLILKNLALSGNGGLLGLVNNVPLVQQLDTGNIPRRLLYLDAGSNLTLGDTGVAKVFTAQYFQVNDALDHQGSTLGFYGKGVIAQRVLATGASHSVDDVITALQALGLVKQS